MSSGRCWLAVLLAACAGGAAPGASRQDASQPASGGAGAMPGVSAHGAAGGGVIANAGASAPSPAQDRTPARPGECVSTGTIEASLRPANLLFLIDRSGSMNCNLPEITSSAECEQTAARADPSAPSKWQIVREALAHAIAELPETTGAGITYFSNDDVCGVQSQPDVPLRPLDTGQRASLSQSLDAVQPLGGTPIVGGLILAYKHLNPDQTAGVPYGNRFVVLLTDGQESCAADQLPRLLQSELPKAQTAAITTFVIGVPGSEVNRGFLSQLAFAGGTASRPDCDHSGSDPAVGDCHFDMTRDADLAGSLTRALEAIGGRALRCDFDVPQPANGGVLDHAKVNVVYTERQKGEERLIAQDAASPCESADGWQYNADRSKILLCGAACSAVRRAASIRIALGCKSVTVD
jgi:Mg-chelatase subunit ChlD